MIHTIDDESLLIQGKTSFLLIALIKNSFGLCIETADDEYVQGVEAGDLVVVSAPEGGAIEPALMLMDLVRTFHIPLLVLPRDHPGSKRSPMLFLSALKFLPAAQSGGGPIRTSI